MLNNYVYKKFNQLFFDAEKRGLSVKIINFYAAIDLQATGGVLQNGSISPNNADFANGTANEEILSSLINKGKLMQKSGVLLSG